MAKELCVSILRGVIVLKQKHIDTGFKKKIKLAVMPTDGQTLADMYTEMRELATSK